MSGHSKWANIKRQKAVNDSKRSQVFAKMSRAITIAARDGGGDVDSNATLRLAVEKAKEARMPKENIQRAIDVGTGKGTEAANLVDTIYEGFGPNGEAFYIKALTNNLNRTAAEMRLIFSKNNGSMGGAGSTAYIFADVENPLFISEVTDEDQKIKLNKLYDELADHDDVQEVYINFELE